MRETIVADARSQISRTVVRLERPASVDDPGQARGKQCTTAVDRATALRQHAERSMFAHQPATRSSKEKSSMTSHASATSIRPTVKDPAMLAEFDRCAREGTPRPESQAIRAHVPAVFWSFANSWRDVFKNGVADHAIKELCRIYVSRSVLCEFCGNQRSIKAAKAGIIEDDYRDLINFEIVDALRRQAEGRARLCGGDHLGFAGRRQVLGAAAQAFQRAGAGRDRLFRRADHGPAALAAHAQHRAPSDPRRHRRARWRRASRPRRRCGDRRRRPTTGRRKARQVRPSRRPRPPSERFAAE